MADISVSAPKNPYQSIPILNSRPPLVVNVTWVTVTELNQKSKRSFLPGLHLRTEIGHRTISSSLSSSTEGRHPNYYCHCHYVDLARIHLELSRGGWVGLAQGLRQTTDQTKRGKIRMGQGIKHSRYIQQYASKSAPTFEVNSTGIPRIFKYHFPYFFNTFSTLNLRSSIPVLVFIFRNS